MSQFKYITTIFFYLHFTNYKIFPPEKVIVTITNTHKTIKFLVILDNKTPFKTSCL